jgi:hypothetical protein
LTIETYSAKSHEELDYFTLTFGSIDESAPKSKSLLMPLIFSLIMASLILYLACTIWLPRMNAYFSLLEEESFKPLEEGSGSSNREGSSSGEDQSSDMRHHQVEQVSQTTIVENDDDY